MAVVGQGRTFNDSYGADLVHYVDDIVFPGVFDHGKSDLVACPGNFHCLMVNLHRVDFLLEVRCVALDVNNVALVQLAIRDSYARHV